MNYICIVNLFCTFCFAGIAGYSSAQNIFIPLGSDIYHAIDRLEIKSGNINYSWHTSVKPISQSTIKDFYEVNVSSLQAISQKDNFILSKALDNKSDKPLLRHFYIYQKDFYSVFKEDFELHINPVISFQYGLEKDYDDRLYINTKGVEISTMISKKIGLYTLVTENQVKVPSYVYSKVIKESAVPGEGYYKEFKNGKGFDFFTARGYLTVPVIKNITLQFGHDKNFWGNGYRSLVLSDVGANYLFLKINTHVWKINYQNLFTEFVAEYDKLGDRLLKKKYGVFHHLSTNISKHINIGLFETVIFGRNDTTQPQQFELNYLNPVIFYRSVEQSIGSPDNSSMGADIKINILKHISLYGQLLIDDLNFQEFKDKTGWYGNKYGWQAGLKYVDFFGAKNLDIQIEKNTVMPYTYTHMSTDRNYVHYNQALAHPLGANFKEYLGIISYQPISNLFIDAKFIYVQAGTDTGSLNLGSNILNTDINSVQRYGNKPLQGIKTDLKAFEFLVSYQWKPNVYIDLVYQLRKYNSEVTTLDSESHFAALGLRMNIARRKFDF